MGLRRRGGTTRTLAQIQQPSTPPGHAPPILKVPEVWRATESPHDQPRNDVHYRAQRLGDGLTRNGAWSDWKAS